MRIMLLTMFNETRKGLLLVLDYKFNTLTRLFMLAFIFVGIGFFMGDGKLDPGRLASALLGYLIWFYAVMAISDMSSTLMMEANSGTLEQMYMSPTPFSVILFGRTIASFVVSTLMVIVVGGGLMLALRIRVPLHWEGLPIFLLTIVGLFGFGYMIGGATLVFKRVGALSRMTQNLLLFFNGALLPIDRMPEGLALFARTLPSTEGIVVLRKVMLHDASLSEVWRDGSLPFLTLHSAIYLLAGIVIFRWCERIVKIQGTLGQY